VNTLTYKDYIGSVSFAAEDEIFYGKIEHINDLITFESDNAHGLKRAFEEAVDEYVAFCAAKGITLNKFIEITLEKALNE
jgi:predicted HicB family RNase H-like nuclease